MATNELDKGVPGPSDTTSARGAVAQPDRGTDGKFIHTIEGAERDAEAARLRSERMSYPAIARALGYADHTGAFRAVQRALKAVPVEAVEELRANQAELLDLLERKALRILAKQKPTINMGKRYDDVDDDAQVIQAMNTVLRIEERRARLFNMDVQPKSEAAGDNLVDLEIERLLAKLGSGSEAEAPREPAS